MMTRVGKTAVVLTSAVIAIWFVVLAGSSLVSEPVCAQYPLSLGLGKTAPAATAVVAASIGAVAKSGATMNVNGMLSACTQHPSVTQHALSLLTYADVPVWVITFLLLVFLARMGGRPEPFTPRLARAFKFAGIYLSIGAFVAGIAAGIAGELLMNSMFSVAPSASILIPPVLPSAFIQEMAGLGLILIGHLVKRGVPMQDELSRVV
jgi:hypothetical protein